MSRFLWLVFGTFLKEGWSHERSVRSLPVLGIHDEDCITEKGVRTLYRIPHDI